DDRAAPVARRQPIQRAENDAEYEECEETVRLGIAGKVEIEERIRSRRDANRLDAGEQEDGPEEVGELRRGEREAKRWPGGDALGGEGNGEVAEEHGAGRSSG